MPNTEPIFKSIFAEQWQQLPLVFKKHYANHAYTDEVNTVKGMMNIDYSKFMTFLLPFFRLFHVLVPYKGKDIPVTVNYRSKINSDAFYLDRIFYFPNKKPYAFYSSMKAIQNNEVIEMMRFGIGWGMQYIYDGEKVILQHRKYVWEVFGIRLRLPLEWLLGKGYAEETVIDENTFHVTMTMTHFLLGQLYKYEGNFTFSSLSS